MSDTLYVRCPKGCHPKVKPKKMPCPHCMDNGYVMLYDIDLEQARAGVALAEAVRRLIRPIIDDAIAGHEVRCHDG